MQRKSKSKPLDNQKSTDKNQLFKKHGLLSTVRATVWIAVYSLVVGL